ncbi:MAG: hypothetical protein JO134_16095 [Xanthobacteraceae bacterium]|nr:hypothetical protein [Xanthobacteraceae bacterium]
MRPALAILLLVLVSGAASAQQTFDAKARRYKCLPSNGSCSLVPPRAVQLQPVPGQRRRPSPPYVPCGSRCDLLDRMK